MKSAMLLVSRKSNSSISKDKTIIVDYAKVVYISANANEDAVLWFTKDWYVETDEKYDDLLTRLRNNY